MTPAELPPAVLLAGGRGTRLGPLTDAIPKPLIPVGGRPFIEWPLLQLAAAGFTEVVISIGYQGEAIVRTVGAGDGVGLAVTYAADGPVPLGTLGAVRAIASVVEWDCLPVLYADTILDLDFKDVVTEHRRASGVTATMAVLHNRGSGDASNAIVEGAWVTAYGKHPPPAGAEWIDYGFLVLDRADVASSTGHDLAPFLAAAAEAQRLKAYRATVPFREIGTPASLAATDAWLRTTRGPPGVRPPR